MPSTKPADPSRRSLLAGGAGLALSAAALGARTARAQDAPARWISTTQGQPWQDLSAQMRLSDGNGFDADAFVDPARTYQTIDGFGGCFNDWAPRPSWS